MQNRNEPQKQSFDLVNFAVMQPDLSFVDKHGLKTVVYRNKSIKGGIEEY